MTRRCGVGTTAWDKPMPYKEKRRAGVYPPPGSHWEHPQGPGGADKAGMTSDRICSALQLVILSEPSESKDLFHHVAAAK